MKKYILIIFFLLFASISYAQPPRIDSMFVDEMKSELHIYGSFGSAKGKVWVDSVEMAVKNWSDTLINSSIPDTGKGSIGPVVVGGRGYRSLGRNVTGWSDTIYFAYSYSDCFGLKSAGGNTSLIFFLRLDLSQLLLKKTSPLLNIMLQKNSKLTINNSSQWHDYHGNGGVSEVKNANVPITNSDSSFSFGFKAWGLFSLVDSTLKIQVFSIQGIKTADYIVKNGTLSFVGNSDFQVKNFECTVLLDSMLGIRRLTNFLDPTLSNFTNINPNYYVFPPSELLVQLRYKPNLILPLSGTVYSFNNITKLIWDTLAPMTGYHLQVSSDSLFKTTSIDTITASLSLSLRALTGLTKYFWRVAGINSEGESRWSDVWNFTTGANADVKAINNSALTLSPFPNPSSKELTITYSLPENGNVRIILYDLQGIVIREIANNLDAGEHQVKWDVSQLPSGSYILGLITGKEQKVEIVKIVH